jgi:tetratricopeptide (TPR) repeat protein
MRDAIRRARHAIMTGSLMLSLVAAPAALAAGLDEVQAGNDAFSAGRYEAAVEAFTRGILAGDLEPEALAIAFNNRGVAYGELGDFDRAVADYGKALELQPQDPTAIKNLRIAHIRRGGTAANLGETETALAEYGHAIELDPTHPMALIRRGQLRLNSGDAAGALSDLEAARQLAPDDRNVAALIEQAAQAVAASATPEPLPEPSPATTATAAVPAPESAPSPGPATFPIPAAPPEAAPPEPSAGPPPVATAIPAEPASDEAVGRPFRAVADVNVRSGPGNSYAPSGTLARGTDVQVLGEELGWMRIRLTDGREGFVYRKWLAAVAP